jgi:hypothetical protein
MNFKRSLKAFWVRYRFKPVWRARYREAFFEQAGRNLLFAFILSISLNPFYVVLFSERDSLNYVVIQESYDNPYNLIAPATLSSKEQEVLNRYEVISLSEVERMKEFETRISWIAFTALLGWCVTSPRFMRGWTKIVRRIQNE